MSGFTGTTLASLFSQLRRRPKLQQLNFICVKAKKTKLQTSILQLLIQLSQLLL